MNEKISSVLTTQAKQIKRLGVYTAVVLVVFTGFIFLLGMELKKAEVREEAKNLPPAAVEEAYFPAVIPADSELKEVAALEEKPKHTVPPVPASSEAAESSEIKSIERQNPATKSISAAAVKIKDIQWPAKGKIIRNFGLSYSQTFSDYRFHKGVDIELQRGAEVMAVLDGKVVSTETDKGEMGVIKIDHGSQWITSYAHLNEIYVIPGDRIKQGQVIGTVDQPGLNEVLEGPHLHFELLKDGKEVNPLEYLPKA